MLFGPTGGQSGPRRSAVTATTGDVMSAKHSKIDRRFFLKSAAAGLGAGLPAWFVEECHGQDKPAKPLAANDRPQFALIGCGGQGRGIAKHATNFGTLVAVCDVDAKHAEQAAQ